MREYNTCTLFQVLFSLLACGKAFELAGRHRNALQIAAALYIDETISQFLFGIYIKFIVH